MNLERLRLFLQIVDSGSMSAAARAVHLTQPALSRTLKLFEEDMGVALFTRRGPRAGADAGRPRAGPARARAARRQRPRRARGRALGRARVLRSAPGDGRQRRDHAAAAVVPALRRDFPDLAIKLSTARTGSLLGRVRSGDLGPGHRRPLGSAARRRRAQAGTYRLQFFGRRDVYPRLAEARPTPSCAPSRSSRSIPATASRS